MEAGLVEQGVELMLFGMGTVVSFLTLMVFTTSAMSALINKYLPMPVEPEKPAAVAAGEDQTLVAVITAAIHQHRSRR